MSKIKYILLILLFLIARHCLSVPQKFSGRSHVCFMYDQGIPNKIICVMIDLNGDPISGQSISLINDSGGTHVITDNNGLGVCHSIDLGSTISAISLENDLIKLWDSTFSKIYYSYPSKGYIYISFRKQIKIILLLNISGQIPVSAFADLSVNVYRPITKPSHT